MKNTLEPMLNELATEFDCIELNSRETRALYREELAKIEEEAFKENDFKVNSGVNLMRNLPRSVFYNPNNILLIIEDPSTGVVEGFTFLEKHDPETYTETITAVVHQGQSNVNQLLSKRDALLKEKGFRYVLTQVDEKGGYAKKLQNTYRTVDLRDGDEGSANSDQKTLRLEL